MTSCGLPPKGQGRGLPPQVTSWGFWAGSARPPSRWGADSSRRGGGAESRAHGGAGRARDPPYPPPGAGSGLCPELGGADEGRAAWRCLRPSGELWKPGFPLWGVRLGRSYARRPSPASVSLTRDAEARAAA